MKKLLSIAIAIGFISTGVQASCNSTSCTGKVTKIYMTADGTLYVGTDGNERSLNCTAPGGIYVSLSNTDPGKNAMYSLLLTAQTTGTPVTIRIQENSPTCRILYVSKEK